MIKKLHPDSVLFGFLNGPHGIFSNNYMEITADYMNLFRNTGGFDMIRKWLRPFAPPFQTRLPILFPPHQTLYVPLRTPSYLSKLEDARPIKQARSQASP